jgi:hypothetical protein
MSDVSTDRGFRSSHHLWWVVKNLDEQLGGVPVAVIIAQFLEGFADDPAEEPFVYPASADSSRAPEPSMRSPKNVNEQPCQMGRGKLP